MYHHSKKNANSCINCCNRANVLTICSALCVGAAIVCLCVEYWVTTTTDNSSKSHTGLFVESHGQYEFDCNVNMSTTECGYLNSSKLSGIVSCMFGFIALLVFIKYARYEERLTPLGAAIASTLLVLESIFGIMCVVTYSYLKDSYMSDGDDLNVEYPENPLSIYSWGYFLMCCSAGFAFLVAIVTLKMYVFTERPGGYDADDEEHVFLTTHEEDASSDGGMVRSGPGSLSAGKNL